MYSFRNVILRSANEAVKSCLYSERFVISHPQTPPVLQGSLDKLRDFINRGTTSRLFSSKKPTMQDELGHLVSLKSKMFDKHMDETRSSNPVIVLHGLLDRKENFSGLAKQLNRKLGRRIFTVDARNHGASLHTYLFSYEFMVCDLVLFIRTKKMQRATLIGHNLGGRVAMMLAMRYPDLVQSLVVVDSSPVSNTDSLRFKTLLRDLKNLMLDRHYTLKEARKQAAAQLREKKYNETLINFLLTNMSENEWHTNWKWIFNLESISNNFEREIRFFPIVNSPCLTRTLFIGGGDSDYLLPHDEPHIKKLFPFAQFAYIPGAGHWVQSDKPVEFLDTVTSFIEKDPTKLQEQVEKHPCGRPVEMSFHKYEDQMDKTKKSIPIIILHGLLGSKQNWHSMAIQIHQKTGRVVWTLDVRNHGDSPHSELFNYELISSDVLVFFRKHKIPKATIIGHSMGGRAAMMLAQSYPPLVQSLVVVDISPCRCSPNMLGITQLLKDIKELKLDPRLTLQEAREQARSQLKEKVQDERIVPFILTNLVSNTGKSNWRWKFNLDSIMQNFESEIASFPILKMGCDTRTLFLGGSNSDYINPNDEVLMKRLFPNSELSFIQGAGHWVHAEKPAAFLASVLKFIEKDPVE